MIVVFVHELAFKGSQMLLQFNTSEDFRVVTKVVN